MFNSEFESDDVNIENILTIFPIICVLEIENSISCSLCGK